MIISHKHKFIFIKNSKTAGTSIEVFLSQLCGKNDIVTPIFPHVEPHVARNYKGLWNPLREIVEYQGKCIRRSLSDILNQNMFYNHMPIRLVKCRISHKIYHDYYKFCIERNPWDKTLSHYHMINARSGGNISFTEYIEKGNFCNNYAKYTNREGKQIVDKVVKYEFLLDELDRIFSYLGIQFNGSLGVRAKSGYRKDRRPYRELYTQTQKEIIEKAYANEIEMHGYTF